MEDKPTSFSRLNIKSLKQLLLSAPEADIPRIQKRIETLQAKYKAKKNVNDTASLSPTEEVEAVARPGIGIPLDVATKLLRNYYNKKYAEPVTEKKEVNVPVNNITKNVVLESNLKQESSSFLSNLDKEYEVIEITLKLLKKFDCQN